MRKRRSAVTYAVGAVVLIGLGTGIGVGVGSGRSAGQGSASSGGAVRQFRPVRRCGKGWLAIARG
ncbi:MAG TPA: hypothetical protein VFQ44_04015 [Streptosporangiaceae bacterium]|nr:hypothetical protein [Streptosporangiaceae bacterium]